MKPTYSLIGVYWDGRPETNSEISLIQYDPLLPEIDSPPSLFDIIERKRKVRLSSLFALKSDSDLLVLIEKLYRTPLVAIELDCLPSSLGRVHQSFFQHRTLQVIKTLEDQLPHSAIVLMLPKTRRAA